MRHSRLHHFTTGVKNHAHRTVDLAEGHSIKQELSRENTPDSPVSRRRPERRAI